MGHGQWVSSPMGQMGHASQNVNQCQHSETVSACVFCVIVVTFELFEVYYWLELCELHYKRNKVHKVKKLNKCVRNYK